MCVYVGVCVCVCYINKSYVIGNKLIHILIHELVMSINHYSNVFLFLAPPPLSLTALSLSGCQLKDSDLNPLCSAIEQGLNLQNVKLAGMDFK